MDFHGRESMMIKGYGINTVGERLFDLYNDVINGKKED